jgi:hypothetical protein
MRTAYELRFFITLQFGSAKVKINLIKKNKNPALIHDNKEIKRPG